MSFWKWPVNPSKAEIDLGLGVQGSGCRVQGSGFRVQGLDRYIVKNLRVQGSGFRFQG